MAEPVDWTVEYLCFVLERTVTTLSPYLRHGQLAEAEDGTWPAESGELEEALAFANAFLADHTAPAPPATVVDVGYIRGRGRAVVEANGAWASGICGADPARVLPVLARA